MIKLLVNLFGWIFGNRKDVFETFLMNSKIKYYPFICNFICKRNKINFWQSYNTYRAFEKRTVNSKGLFKKSKKSDTLAILGSGMSINDISSDEFNY